MSQQRPEKTLNELVGTQLNSLGCIKEKILQLQRLNAIWQQYIDNIIAQHCKIANYREGILIIVADSSVWSMRLRYLIPDLLIKLRNHPEFRSLKNIEWFIKPTEETPTKTTQSLLKLSSNNAEMIQSIAEGIENKQLQKALLKLTQHS